MKITDLPANTLAPVQHLISKLGVVDLPKPAGYQVLVLQYVRPAASSGGIIFAQSTKKEDVWQGRVGLVLDVGPDAYADQGKFPSGAWCKPGDYVMWPPIEAAAARFAYAEDVTLALIADDKVLATGVDPFRAVTSG